MTTKTKTALPTLATAPRGEYKFITKTSGSYEVDDLDYLVAAYFTETNQFMISTRELAQSNVGYAITDATRNVPYVRFAEKRDLSQRVQYLYKLLDDFGFRIYALFVLGTVENGMFKAFDIYAGVAGQGSFLPLDQVKMFLEQTNIAEVERTQ